jgi:O-antigen ligase
MDRVADKAPPLLRRARPSIAGTSGRAAANGASVAAVVPARFEWGIAIAVLFVLGRWPVLFLRERLTGALGPTRLPDWQYDTYVRLTFAVAEAAIAVLAVRRVRLRSLRRVPLLLAFLVLAWASTIWSLEPGVTIWRSIMLIGAAVVGWYVGERFTLEQIDVIVARVAAVGTAASYLALLIVPKVATRTDVSHAWSGAYYNRNELGLILSAGILASAFHVTRTTGRARIAEVVVIAAEVLLLAKSGNRTGPMALGGALVACLIVFAVRRYTKGKLVVFWASILSLGTILIGFGAVEWQWKRIVDFVGRNITLSSRSFIWRVDRAFIHQKPWGGWGFEAFWSNTDYAQYVVAILHRFPFNAHNGYYEVALGIGWPGLALLGGFLAIMLYRGFTHAWRGRDIISLWPLAFVLFVLAANFTESLFVSGEALFALLVAVALALSRTTTILVRRPTS